MAVVLALPYSLPPLAETLLGRAPGEWIYLIKPVENQFFFLLAGIFTLAVPFFILRALAPPRRFPRNTIPFLAAAVVACQLVSIFGAPSFASSIRAWMLPLSGLTGMLILLSSEADRRSVEKLMLTAVLAGIPAAAYGIAQSQGWEFLPYQEITAAGNLLAEDTAAKQRVSSTFGHPNYLASYLAPLVFWALYFALAKGRVVRRLVGAVGFVLFVSAMILGGTRGALLAAGAAFFPFYLALALTPAYRRQILFAGGMAVAAAVALAVVPNPFVSIRFDVRERLFASKEITSRFYYWTVAAGMAKDRPLLGVGYGGYDPLYYEYAAQLQRTPEGPEYEFMLRDSSRMTRPGYVHNDHLQILAEGGVVTAAAWLALWTAFLCQTAEAIRRGRHRAEAALLCAAFLASGGAMAVDAVFSFPFHIPVSGFFFWLLLGSWAAWRGFGGATCTGSAELPNNRRCGP